MKMVALLQYTVPANEVVVLLTVNPCKFGAWHGANPATPLSQSFKSIVFPQPSLAVKTFGCGTFEYESQGNR